MTEKQYSNLEGLVSKNFAVYSIKKYKYPICGLAAKIQVPLYRKGNAYYEVEINVEHNKEYHVSSRGPYLTYGNFKDADYEHGLTLNSVQARFNQLMGKVG